MTRKWGGKGDAVAALVPSGVNVYRHHAIYKIHYS